MEGRRLPGLGCLAAVLLLLIPASGWADGVYTIREALREFHDLGLLQRPADPPRRFAQFSSNDPGGGNFDQGNFLREEGLEHVMVDVRGPGVLTRLWTAEPMGVLRFYFDGSPDPQITVLWSDLQEGRVPWLREPFVSSTGGGCTMRFPLPFAESLRVTLTGQTWCHWQAGYHYFPPGTEVESWWPAKGLPAGVEPVYTEAAATWRDAGLAPVPGRVLHETWIHMAAGLEPYRFRAEEDLLLTEVAVLQASRDPLPDGFRLALLDGSGYTLGPVPWRALAGMWDTPGDSASLLHGRLGQRSYLRVPFVLRAGEELEFSWPEGVPGEFIGGFELRGRPLAQGEPAPELLASLHRQRAGAGERLVPPALEGNGRLLLVASRISATGNALYMEGDEYIYLDGEQGASIRGTGMEDLFDSAWYFMNGPFTTAMAASPLQEEGLLEVVARVPWWPHGIPFARELRFELQAGPVDDAPPTEYELLLLGQSFGEAHEVAPPAHREGRRTGLPTGARGTVGADSAGLPVYTEQLPLVTGEASPLDVWFPAEGSMDGTARFTLHPEGAELLAIHLDLPYGWTGELRAPGHEPMDVQDIGWPFAQWRDPAPGTFEVSWVAHPPERLTAGPHVVQLRAHARLADGTEETVRRPLRLLAEPRGEPDHEWDATAVVRGGRVYTLDLPEGFEGRPGDYLSVEAEVDFADGQRETSLRVHFSPVLHGNDEEPLSTEVEQFVGPDGEAWGRSLLGGERHWATVRVGRDRSWLGPKERLEFHWDGVEAEDVRVHRVRLYRQAPMPTLSGWSGNLPYEELREGTFQLPAATAILEGPELRRAMHREVATPPVHVAPEFRRAEVLENIESGLMHWRFAEPAHRVHGLTRSFSMLFPSPNTGERLRIEHESLRGARYLAIEFGFGPWCGRAGVRDCEGRLVAARDLYMNLPVTLPQYTWIVLPVENRDPWIYIESLGPAPGSFEQRIPIQKVMVLREQP